ncbi:hypothetical protein HK405_005469, partial [Cladochytrium tenue]
MDDAIFGGDVRPRKAISLGGRSQTRRAAADRAELLRRAALDRAARDRARRELRAATLLQAFVRGRAAAREARNGLRREWDEDLAGLLPRLMAADAATAGASPPSAASDDVAAGVVRLAVAFAFFYRPHADAARLAALASLLCRRLPTPPRPMAGHADAAVAGDCHGDEATGLPLLFAPFRFNAEWPRRLKRVVAIFVGALAFDRSYDG